VILSPFDGHKGRSNTKPRLSHLLALSVVPACFALCAPGARSRAAADSAFRGDSARAVDSAGSPRLPLPYVEKAGTRGRITIWVVDGSWVRTHRDEEFTNYGQHYAFNFIPRNEFWIDREGVPDELRFFVDHLLVERRLMARGVSYDDALAAADSLERKERKAAGDVARLTAGGKLPDPEAVHTAIWKHLPSGVTVWLVDGRLVRSVFDVDFTEGGHDHVYEFVPPNEVWIDNDVADAERPYILLHELHERNLMAKGWDYDRAHEDASRIELRCRRDPQALHPALAAEGWE